MRRRVPGGIRRLAYILGNFSGKWCLMVGEAARQTPPLPGRSLHVCTRGPTLPTPPKRGPHGEALCAISHCIRIIKGDSRTIGVARPGRPPSAGSRPFCPLVAQKAAQAAMCGPRKRREAVQPIVHGRLGEHVERERRNSRGRLRVPPTTAGWPPLPLQAGSRAAIRAPAPVQ